MTSDSANKINPSPDQTVKFPLSYFFLNVHVNSANILPDQSIFTRFGEVVKYISHSLQSDWLKSETLKLVLSQLCQTELRWPWPSWPLFEVTCCPQNIPESQKKITWHGSLTKWSNRGNQTTYVGPVVVLWFNKTGLSMLGEMRL